uniref:Uncharacterized protein n=1 Tax=Bosea sp. NBC_00436 TaxID=2969620 RepID=A0A9E7ZPH9_9HYPH
MNPMPLTTAIMRSSTNPIEPDDRLHHALDARLLAEPRVIDFRRSARDETTLSSSVAPPGSVTRMVRLIDRILTVVAIPDGSNLLPALRRRLRNHWHQSELLIVSERWIRRRPHFDGSELIAAAARYPVPPLSRVLIAEHLTESGGSSYLSDCAARVAGVQDPVRAVLALAAAKYVALDISRPIGPLTQVSLPPSR